MTGTYDPTLNKFVYGVLPVSGYADGSMIQINPVGDGVKAVTGTAGETAFIETPNRQHEIMFRLFETSPFNAALALAFNAGNPPVPITVISLSTGATMAAGAGKLERIPGVTYDNNVPVREWKVVVPKLDTLIIPT